MGIGADPEMVGCNRFIIRRRPVPELTWAKGEYRSMRGPVLCEWRAGDRQFSLNITIPPNTTATVFMPAQDPKTVLEGGAAAAEALGVRFLGAEQSLAVFQVGSGQYRFTAPLGM